MHDWLGDALNGTSCVVTANRRLSRALVGEFNEQKLRSGATAWRRPRIHSWPEWLSVLLEQVPPDLLNFARINPQQSRVLWEQCLRRDIDDPLISEASLARLCRDTWARIHEWQVPLQQCQNRAAGQDQRIFARAAGHYQAMLDDNNWVDDALLPTRLSALFESQDILQDQSVTLAGFDRIAPQAERLVNAVIRCGGSLRETPPAKSGDCRLQRFANPDDELRAAGRWAREQLEQEPGLQLGIVVNDLDNDAERTARVLRDGFVPGWQYAGDRVATALNISYGRRLSEFPSVHTALLALRWLSDDLNGADISVLLRSQFLGTGDRHSRARFELRLRDLPDRRWSRDLLLRAFAKQQEKDGEGDGADWLQRIAKVGEMLDAEPQSQSPASWAEFFDRVLDALNWPGDGPLNSVDFQLTNRWRDLLNEFSRLTLVQSRMDIGTAVSKLQSLCSDSLFQPESSASAVTVLGTLEAAGMLFDKLWVTGITAANWPAPARPLVLISRDLQIEFNMPDATPDDTTEYAERVLSRLGRSAAEVQFSYPSLIGDAEQVPTPLIDDLLGHDSIEDGAAFGWHALSLIAPTLIADAPDRIPAARAGETISGGASTINRYVSDPFAAFAHGRLGIKWLPRFVGGIPANVRGNLIHDALSNLYQHRPSQSDILHWSIDDRSTRIERAVDSAFARHFIIADDVLKRLLRLEQTRTASLLNTVVSVDCDRPPFSIVSVEKAEDVRLAGTIYRLRCDRIDLVDGDEMVILDYKTGYTRKFLTSGFPNDLQLVVYALTVAKPVAGLGLFNVDSKHTSIDGAGPALKPVADWDQSLDEWKAAAQHAAGEIASGDVRLNIRQKVREARPLSLLSRYAELHDDD